MTGLPLENPEVVELKGVAASRGRSALSKVSRFLEDITPSGLTPLSEAFELAARKLRKRCHVVILSDFLRPDAGLAGLSQLRYRRHRLSLIQILAPQEQDPRRSMSPGEWELFDPEDDAESGIRLDVGQSSFSRYLDLLERHNASLRDFCRAAGAVFVTASSELEPIQFFSEDLRKAGLLT